MNKKKFIYDEGDIEIIKPKDKNNRKKNENNPEVKKSISKYQEAKEKLK